LTILCADEFPQMKEYIDKYLPNVSHYFVKMKDPFGCHHSKIGIYVYEDNSLRVVVSTANLYYEDWNHYNQGYEILPQNSVIILILKVVVEPRLSPTPRGQIGERRGIPDRFQKVPFVVPETLQLTDFETVDPLREKRRLQ
jgi:hypothetical protein